MLQAERQNEILDYLKKNGRATTVELSEMLGVSTTTIRNDLNQMDKDGFLTKTHGGALFKASGSNQTELTSRAYHYHERELEHKEEKEAIANCAKKYVKDHMCVFLDASSTAYTLGLKLTGYTQLTIITNGINLALALKDVPGITVILTGGIVTSASSSIEGLLGQDMLRKIHTDIAFVSARGFSIDNGLTDFSIYEADLKRECVKCSGKTIALVDHTKFGSASISSYASLDDINVVITDSGIADETLAVYRESGVEVVVADDNML